MFPIYTYVAPGPVSSAFPQECLLLCSPLPSIPRPTQSGRFSLSQNIPWPLLPTMIIPFYLSVHHNSRNSSCSLAVHLYLFYFNRYIIKYLRQSLEALVLMSLSSSEKGLLGEGIAEPSAGLRAPLVWDNPCAEMAVMPHAQHYSLIWRIWNLGLKYIHTIRCKRHVTTDQ